MTILAAPTVSDTVQFGPSCPLSVVAFPTELPLSYMDRPMKLKARTVLTHSAWSRPFAPVTATGGVCPFCTVQWYSSCPVGPAPSDYCPQMWGEGSLCGGRPPTCRTAGLVVLMLRES